MTGELNPKGKSLTSFGSVAEFTKAYRTRCGLTQEALAKELGVSPQYISNVESERHTRPVSFAMKLMKILSRPQRRELKTILILESMDRVDRFTRK